VRITFALFLHSLIVTLRSDVSRNHLAHAWFNPIEEESMKSKALAIANNDLVYLWWTYEGKITDCLGFTIRRLQKGKPPVALPAYVGFQPAKKGDPPPVKRPTTDYWPIQAYQWKDLFVPEETEVSYEIVPVTGTPGEKLKEIPGLKVRTNAVKATDTIGKHRVVFNRGIISTQALSKKLEKGKDGSPSQVKLREHIAKPGDKIRNGLAGEAIGALTSLLDRARDKGGKCFCALYELTDTELIDALKANKDRVEVILSNADSSKKDKDGKTIKIYDGTNADTRADLHAVLGNKIHDRLLAKGNYIGHNKFVVYVNKSGKAKAVLTGSTNWTPTGLCAQSNNILIIEDDAIAKRYLDYWNRLLADDAGQGATLRSDDAVEPPELKLGSKQGKARVWFSPNTPQKIKPSKNPPTPPDMDEVFQAINGAKHGVLFLVFSPGVPSILSQIRDVSKEREKANKNFFVRGAISDATASTEFSTSVYNDSLLKAPNVLIAGIGGVPDDFSFWEKELAKLGHAVIHDKIVVIDPFTDDCVVITGSHNLGFKASYSNDENLCIIRGNRGIAEAYTSHVLDVVNHYNWRYKLNEKKKETKSALKAFTDLGDDDTWQDKYFKGNFLKNRDMFFFPE
jgi:phosphatidylserine/phosphatidylglycerophosphate/cardiolipin synthase-like enzyme